MSWPTPLHSIGSVGIYVSEMDPQQEAVIGELHVIDALNSTKHYSGSTGIKMTIAGVLVCSDSSGGLGSELTTLYGYAESFTSRTFTCDKGAIGSFKVKNVRAKRKQALNWDYPVYEVSLDLWEA